MKLSYVIKRVLYSLFVFAVVITLNFFIPRIGVEDPAERYYPPQGNMSEIEYEIVKQLTREQYGFHVSTWQQFLNYLKGLAQGDLGTSFRPGSPKVLDLIKERLPWTLVLSVSTMLIGLIVGVLFGVVAAVKRGRWQDTLLLNASTVMVALPSFFIALVLSFYLGFEWEIFPAYTDSTMVSEFAWTWEGISRVARNAALPVMSMMVGSISYARDQKCRDRRDQ